MAFEASARTTELPANFGKYELLELLGRGGMAEVFLARTSGPMGFERTLVIKRILPHASGDEEFRRMFVTEAKLSANLAHGNIVQVYEFGEVRGQLFLAMEYVPGTDLRALLKQFALEGTRLPVTVAVHVAIELLQGLGYAHARTDLQGHHLGIVHRDVSPSNVLLSAHGEVKICDFGIAKMAAHHTSTGNLKGKFSYMSPEQAGGGAIDARSDLFAVGTVLWEALAGARLFKGESDVSTLTLVRDARISDPPDMNAPMPDYLRAVLRRSLERLPADRYPTAEEFAAALREYQQIADLDDPVQILRGIVRPRHRPVPASDSRSGVVRSAVPMAQPSDAVVTVTTPQPTAEPTRARSLRRVLLVAAGIAISAVAAIALLWSDGVPKTRRDPVVPRAARVAPAPRSSHAAAAAPSPSAPPPAAAAPTGDEPASGEATPAASKRRRAAGGKRGASGRETRSTVDGTVDPFMDLAGGAGR